MEILNKKLLKTNCSLKVFKKEGVEYKKLMIPGHETPAKNLVDK